MTIDTPAFGSTPSEPPEPSVVRLDDGTVIDLITGDVARPNGLRPHLARQPLRAFVVLLKAGGFPVPAAAFDGRLGILSPNSVIKVLRQAIGDDGTRQYYIESVHPLGGELSWRLRCDRLEITDRFPL